MQELKALEILNHLFFETLILRKKETNYKKIQDLIKKEERIKEARSELIQYEENFKQKEFDYRTQYQNVVSAARIEADAMPDRLAELEKVILDCYLAQGYQIGVGDWGFKVEINSRYKHKSLNVLFGDEEGCRPAFTTTAIISSEMFDKAIEFFNLWTLKILELQNDSNNI